MSTRQQGNNEQSIRIQFQDRVAETNGGLALAIKHLAREVGFAACGITSAEPFEEFGVAIQERMKRFPEASHLYSPMQERVAPRSLAPWVNSIVVCISRYGKYEIPEGLVGHIGRSYLFGRINEESPQHEILGKMMDELTRMGFRVQRGDVPDRWAGVRAGVTQFGRNCFAYSEHGSWIEIETWLVDALLPTDKPILDPVCPKGCQACINACPTGALVEPFVMRMDRCVAYLTYSAPEPIPSELWNKMGAWIYGCDRCQEVCPLNKQAWNFIERAPWVESIASLLRPAALARMDQKTYRDVVYPRFGYIPVDNLARWQRNAARAVQHVLQ